MNKIAIILYSIFLISLTVFTYLFIDPGFFYFKNIFTGIAFAQRPLVSILYCLSIFLFFGFYLYFVLGVIKKKISSFQWKLIIGLSFLLLLFSYPTVLSFDLFNYIATAKVTYFYGENPYMVMPIEFTNEPFLSHTRAANKFALYGPSWIFLTAIPYFLSFQNVILQIFLFKFLVGSFYILAGYVFYKISRSTFLTALFLLNPFVLIETFVSGHNDIVMIFFALTSFYFLQKKRMYLAVLFIILSILIKYATLFLLPVFLFACWKTFRKKEISWPKIWKLSLISLGLILLLSPLREELYPWYFLWIFPYMLLVKSKLVIMLALSLSFGLLFYYVPYMYTGHYLLIPKYLSVLICSGFFLSVLYILRNKLFKK